MTDRERTGTPVPGGTPDRPAGLLVVQVDGLSRPLLEELMASGAMPLLASLVRRGRLVLDGWTPELPPCTPASQAGILHGTNEAIPGFRWFEKETGRLLVANRPQDATEIARRVSNGHGLLAAGGVSIGNLLTGDAPRSHLTLATIEGDPSGHDRAPRGGDYPRDPRVYARILGLGVADLARELAAAFRDPDRNDPLTASIRWRYLLQRFISSVPLRVLSTALVARALRQGRPVVYVDFTGHDEAAHSRGPRKPAARRAATAIDDSLGVLLREARRSPRRYRLVVLSDHGQSWGATFTERYGVPVERLISSAIGPDATFHGATLPLEYHDSTTRLAGRIWPPRLGTWAAAALDRLRPSGSRSGGGTAGAGGQGDQGDQGDDGEQGGGAGRGGGGGRHARGGPEDPARADVVVAASGSLALVSFPRIRGVASRGAIDARYPHVLPLLRAHPGIALVAVRSEEGTLALGAIGSRNLATGAVEGSDPLAAFGDDAVASLRRLAGFENAGDLILLGTVDQATSSVVSFEELAGTHGGLGGWQTRPFIAHPPELTLDGPLTGAPSLYGQLIAWMRKLGLPDPRDGAQR